MNMLKLGLLDIVACTGTGVTGAFSIDTSGGGSSFVNGIIGTHDRASRAELFPF